jgi:hypothetical protein
MKNEEDAAIRLVRFLKDIGVYEHICRTKVPKLEEEWKEFNLFLLFCMIFFILDCNIKEKGALKNVMEVKTSFLVRLFSNF